MDREKKTKGFFSFYQKDFIFLPMTKVLPSTFHFLDKHYSVLDDRRTSIAVLRHATVPLTILADMIVGVAHLIFLGVRSELNENLFWEVTHQQLFEYPLQQLIYFIFSSIGTLMEKDYAKGYELGQWAVLNLSFEAYRGRPVIFEHMSTTYAGLQYFPNIVLNNEDRRNLEAFREHTIRFRDYQEQITGESPIKSKEPLYLLFYEERPHSIQDLERIYLDKVGQMRLCNEREALQEAKRALESFFALPLVLRVHLLRPTH